jgi:hypothetical protein
MRSGAKVTLTAAVDLKAGLKRLIRNLGNSM